MIGRLIFVISLSLLMFKEIVSYSNDHNHLKKYHSKMPNTFRYASIANQITMPTLEQFIVNHQPIPADHQDTSKYTINGRDLTESATATGRYGELDNEDRNLLDEFYRETRHKDPFQGDLLVNSQELWNGQHDEELSKVLADLSDQRQSNSNMDIKPQAGANMIETHQPISHNDWTIDPRLLMINQIETPSQNSNHSMIPDMTLSDNKIAKYSPIHRLLTLYDPIKEKIRAAMDKDQERGSRGNRVVGATLYGKGQSLKPVVSSKSSKQAVKLHDELFEEPPRDGIARVRMYFHRAIHDDIKLYGTGPWKYWGHGWGVEFGYDPNVRNPKFYQKGYTIERAYGRDFCKDKRNCRPPDPDFFNSLPRINIESTNT